MKCIFVFLVLIWSISECFAQENFSLSLELIKPSGKIDGKSYFLARLKNHNDSLNMFVAYKKFPEFLPYSYFKAIYDIIGEPEYTTDRKPFFENGDKKYVLIGPSSEYQIKLPLFQTIDAMGGSGLLPLSSKILRKFRRIRIELENFEFTPMMVGSHDPRHFYPKKSINLYSNWININGEEFLPELLKNIRPDD